MDWYHLISIFFSDHRYIIDTWTSILWHLYGISPSDKAHTWPLGAPRPQGPKAWNLGDFDKASASIKHSRKRSAAAKDWGSMASGIHGGNHGNIWWGATNLAKHMDSNSRHMEIFNKTQHDMIWHDQKKTRKMRLKSCLSWFIHQNPWDFYGFLYLQPTAPRGKGRPQDLGEDAAAWAAEAPAASNRTVIFRWIGGSVFTEDGRFFWKIFADCFFWNVGKTMENPSFWMSGFWSYQKPTIFKGQ